MENLSTIIRESEIRNKLVPESWSYVYITVDLKMGVCYIGSHNNKNPKYLGSGTIISSIAKKRPETLLHFPIFWCYDETITRSIEDWFLKYYKVSSNPNFYNLKEEATGGNCFKGKSKEEMREISQRSSLARKKTIDSKDSAWWEAKAKKQREALLSGAKENSKKIKLSLSKKTKEQKRGQQLQNLKSRFQKGKISVIEVFDNNQISRGIYFGACHVSRQFPITSVCIRVSIQKNRPITRGLLEGWRFIIREGFCWEVISPLVHEALRK